MDIALIAALSENHVIGNKGKIPWHIPEDLQRFKRLTLYHPVIMGRKTYESIIAALGKALPKRKNIVISSQKLKSEGITVVRTLDEALAHAQDTVCYIIGGERVYREALPRATRLELTHVRGNYEGDAFFPRFNVSEWNKSQSAMQQEYEFATYTRKSI